MKRVATIVFAAIVAVGTAAAGTPLRPPLGLDVYMPVPETNALSHAKVALGRAFFFDKRLSLDGTLACASCHDPRLAFSDGRSVARGIHGAEGTRNAPTLVNRGYGASFFWDGRAGSLERQVLEPIVNPIELGLSETELARRTRKPAADVAAALASYVRTIRSGNSPFDRYVAGEPRALSELEQAGLAVFRGKGACNTCHVGPNFTDERYHNTGVAWRDRRLADEGRFTVSADEHDRGAFKTPTLREVARTAPYMHDGSLPTLDAVVEFYSQGGRQNPYLDSAIRPRQFTVEEKHALVAFLRSLTGRVVEGWGR
jgi:cytochrome c peroxidase